MRSIFIAVIACLGLGLISAFIPPNVIQSDLAEINKLSQEFKNLSPASVRRFAETTCQMVSECCPQIQSTFASMSLQGQSQSVFEQCFGRKDSPQAMSKLRSCGPLNQLKSISSDPAFQKFAKVASKSNQDSQNKALIATACSAEELQALACDSNNVQLHNSCQRKVLERLAQQGDSVYQGQVQQMKDNLNKVIGELRSA